MFLDGVGPPPKVEIAAEIAALFEADPRPHPRLAPRRGRTVAVVVTARDAEREAQRLAPALRACRALGDEVEVFVLPSDEESPPPENLETVCRTLGVERVDSIPDSGPMVRGLAQREMCCAYRAYEFLKSRAPDVVLSTQALGVPYFAIRARALGVSLQDTRFVVVLGPFELQRRLNERVVTSTVRTLIRFHLERAAAEGADVCVAPSFRFVENALRTGAAAKASRFMVLPEVEEARAVKDPAPRRPPAFVIPDVPPVKRNAAFFAVVAKRRPDALRSAEGGIRLFVDAADPNGEIAASCRERFAGTNVVWTVGPPGEGAEDAVLFAPFCEDFFALGAGLAPAVRGARILIGEGAAAGEPFEAAGIAAAPFPDVVAEALTEAAAGRRALRVSVRSAELDRPWTRFFENLSPPRRPAEAPGDLPWVTVCVLCFNRPGLVGQAVSSALAQTYENLDVLLFDDGSNAPGAVETLQALAESRPGRVRLVRQDNRYIGAARNRAARAAKREYVFFLDDDDVLKPSAIATLVRAARVSDADFVGSFSDVFTGECLPKSQADARQRLLRAGGDGGFSLLRNAILDGSSLCRRQAFLALGGNIEEYGLGGEDMEFFARAVRSGRRVAVVPEALLWIRHGHERSASLRFDRGSTGFRVLEAYWPAVAPGYRALLLLFQGMFVKRLEHEEWIEALSGRLAASRRESAERGCRLEVLSGEIEALTDRLAVSRQGHVMALACRASRLGFARPEVGVLLDRDWLDRTTRQRGGGPVLELHRNRRLVARATVRDPSCHVLQIGAGTHVPVGGACYSLHDAVTGEGLAVLAAPSWRRSRRIEGVVESRPRMEVRGWVLDPSRPERIRRAAVHVDGRFREVVRAEEPRADLARWKKTGGRHGFRWRIPAAVAAAAGTLIDVFDADTGRPLRGSPVRVAGGEDGAEGRGGARVP